MVLGDIHACLMGMGGIDQCMNALGRLPLYKGSLSLIHALSLSISLKTSFYGSQTCRLCESTWGRTDILQRSTSCLHLASGALPLELQHQMLASMIALLVSEELGNAFLMLGRHMPAKRTSLNQV